MEIRNLMVGDWASVSGKSVKITKDDLATMLIFLDDDSKISPIPLTEDILVKNGFEKCHNDEAPVDECYFYFFRLFNKQCGWFDIDAFGLEEELGAEFTYHDVNINYVHQLQHLLRLCGIEKEIKL